MPLPSGTRTVTSGLDWICRTSGSDARRHASAVRITGLTGIPRRCCPQPDWLIDRVPLEYSIEWLTCAIASRLDVMMVGWPGAAQDRLPRPGRADLAPETALPVRRDEYPSRSAQKTFQFPNEPCCCPDRIHLTGAHRIRYQAYPASTGARPNAPRARPGPEDHRVLPHPRDATGFVGLSRTAPACAAARTHGSLRSARICRAGQRSPGWSAGRRSPQGLLPPAR